MKSCAANCSNDLENDNFIECVHCRDSYHYFCLNLKPQDVKSLTPANRSRWSCPKCLTKQHKSGNLNTPSTLTSMANASLNVTRRKGHKPDPTPSTSDYVMRSELREIIREEMRSVVKECMADIKNTLDYKLREIQDQVSSFRESVNFLSDQYDNMVKDFNACQDEIKTLRKENETLRSESSNLSHKLLQIDQLSRAANLEVLCVPENKNENIINIVKQLGRAVNFNINDNEIHFCVRTAKMNSTSLRPRSILVKMSSPRIRDSLMAAVVAYNKKHSQDKLNTSDLGFGTSKSPVYVVENLSPENKALHAAARLRGKQLQYKFVWVRGGRIFMKKSETSDAVYIRNQNVLQSMQ